jgi:hypothetical protein
MLVESPDIQVFMHSGLFPFQEFSVEHINYFSPDALDNLMGSVGLVRGEGSAGMLAFFHRSGRDVSIMPDRASKQVLAQYIEQSKEREHVFLARFAEIIGTTPKFVVWGVGTQTLHLLASSAFRGAEIVAFIDSNPRYQGAQIGAVPVLAPDALRGRTDPVLICSLSYGGEIEAGIRAMGCENPVLHVPL